jgi:hypothetical protein
MNKFNKSSILFALVIIVLVIIGVYFFANNSEIPSGKINGNLPTSTTTNEREAIIPSKQIEVPESVIRDVKELISTQFKISTPRIELRFDIFGSNYAHGVISFLDINGEPEEEGGPGTFWAVMQANKWKLAFAGNGYAYCDDLMNSGIPLSVVKNDCYTPNPVPDITAEIAKTYEHIDEAHYNGQMSVYDNAKYDFSFSYPSKYDPVISTTTPLGGITLETAGGQTFFSYENLDTLNKFLAKYKAVQLKMEGMSQAEKDACYDSGCFDPYYMTDYNPYTKQAMQALNFYGIYGVLGDNRNGDNIVNIGNRPFSVMWKNIGNGDFHDNFYIATTSTGSYLFEEVQDATSARRVYGLPYSVTDPMGSETVESARSLKITGE